MRTKEFMDAEPSKREVSSEIVDKLNEKYDELKQKWDEKYPNNKV